MENIDVVKAFVARSSSPLAELRANGLAVKEETIKWMDSMVSWGVCIGISPRDDILNKYKRSEINNIIYKIFKRLRERDGVTGALAPVARLSLVLVGEYSDKLRWHYHGLVNVKNIDTLERVKRILQRSIGRVDTQLLRDYNKYKAYMFKRVDDNKASGFFTFTKEDNIIKLKIEKEMKSV